MIVRVERASYKGRLIHALATHYGDQVQVREDQGEPNRVFLTHNVDSRDLFTFLTSLLIVDSVVD